MVGWLFEVVVVVGVSMSTISASISLAKELSSLGDEAVRNVFRLVVIIDDVELDDFRMRGVVVLEDVSLDEIGLDGAVLDVIELDDVVLDVMELELELDDDVGLEDDGVDDVFLVVSEVGADVVDVEFEDAEFEDADLDEVLVVVLIEGKFESSSLLVRSIVVLTLALPISVNDESISIKMETQVAAARDSKPFLKTFCFEGISFLISKIAFILISFSRILKKFSVWSLPESFLSSSLT